MADFAESLEDIAARALADVDGYGDVEEARDNAASVAVAVLRAVELELKERDAFRSSEWVGAWAHELEAKTDV